MRMPRYAARAATLLCVLAAACSDNQGPSNTSLSVKLTDAPASFKAAVVTIAGVYLQGSGGRTTLSSATTTLNLLDLQNATADLVTNTEIAAGTYTQLDIIVTGGYIQLNDGSIYASSATYSGLPAGAQVTGVLQLPSYAQTGIKVTLPNEALSITGTQKILLIDFDVSQSYGQDAGASGQWVMTPVIKGADITATGSVAVSLTLGQGVTLPTITVNGTTRPATLADFSATLGGKTQQLDATGAVTFQFLLPDTYALSFTGPAGLSFTTSPATPISVTVPSGQQVSASATITAASAP